MSSNTRRGWLAAVWLAAAASTHAQPAPAPGATSATGAPGAPGPTSAPNPLQAGTAVPPTVYSSPLARYRVAADVEVGSWTEVNDTVTRIGGWRAYAREASQPEVPALAPAPAASSPPAAPGHGKH